MILKKLHRTWVQLLVDMDYKECAAIAIDTELSLLHHDDWNSNSSEPYGIAIHIPTSSYGLLKSDTSLKKILPRSLIRISNGHLFQANDKPEIEYRIKFVEVEENWKSVARELIVNYKRQTQGLISELMANKTENKFTNTMV